jgi:DNA-binding beta-propeller fold protein YncE
MIRFLRLAVLGVTLSATLSASLVISNPGTNSVLQYSDSGTSLGTFVSSGSGGLSDPGGLAFGSTGDLFVVSRNNNSVLRFAGANGASIETFINSNLNSPTDLAFGPDGNIYVANAGPLPAQIQRFDATTAAYLGNFITGAVPDLNTPLYIDFGSGELAVGTGTDRVYRFNGITGAALGSLVRDTPEGVAYGPDGALYIAQRISGNIVRRAPGGTLTEFVPMGSGGLVSPTDIAFGPDGNLYVLSNGGDRVLRFNGGSGAFLDLFITAGSGGLSGGTYMTFQPTAVPEPTSGILGFGALLLLAIMRPVPFRT